jgi:hypothetical protein
MKEEMIKQMNDKQIVEHYLNGFAEECSNVLLNRQDYDVLVNKCLKMLGEQRGKKRNENTGLFII